MHIAYIILVHKQPLQLLNIIQQMKHEDDYFFVHVDKKSELKDFVSIIDMQSSNCCFLVKRQNGRWGDLGIVKATLDCMRAVNNHSVSFDHIVLLSGQDYPIKPLDEIRGFLERNIGYSFIEYQGLPTASLDYGGLNRINAYSFNVMNRRETYIPWSWTNSFNFKGKMLNLCLGFCVLFLPKRKFPFGWQPYYGSQWWSMSKEAYSKALKFLDNDRKYFQYHKYSLLPDEMFFQSLLLNLYDGSTTIINNNYRYIEWSENSNSPNVLTSKDLKKLINCSALFARKFDINVDVSVVDELKKCINK